MRRRLMPRAFRRSPIAYWSLTLLLAATTGLVVARLVARAEAAAARYGSLRVVPVVVRPVGPGEVLEPADVVARPVPAAFLPSGTFPADPVGHAALVPLLPGEVVVREKLAPWGVQGAAALLPPGTRAVAVPAGPGARPPVRPLDRVDVLASYEFEARVVATGALVVDVADPESVTVAVAADEAPAVAHAVAQAAVVLAVTGPPGASR